MADEFPVEALSLDLIRTDGGTQARVGLNEGVVAEYAAEYSDGKDLGPAVVFHDGSDYWLADGFHRYFGRKQAGCFGLDCQVRKGTKRDAILYAIGANAEHGLKRSNADKRRAVEMLLADKEWNEWSSRTIAHVAKVSRNIVNEIRGGGQVALVPTGPVTQVSSSSHPSAESDRRTGTDGKSYPAAATPMATSADATGDQSPTDPDDEPLPELEPAEDVAGEQTATEPAAPAAAAPPDFSMSGIVKDFWGQAAPEPLWPVMKAGHAFRALARHLTDKAKYLREEAASLQGQPEEEEADDEAKSMESTAAKLRLMAPYCLCPRCGGFCSGDCLEKTAVCGGRGWLSEAEYPHLTEPDRLHVERFKRRVPAA